MTDESETRTFDLEAGHGGNSNTIRRLLQPLGDEAWEITYVGSSRDRSGTPFGPFDNVAGGVRWVEARRPPYGAPGPSSWEYTGFNTYGMPEPNWSAHLASRGWEKVPGKWYSYFQEEWYIFRRTDAWRGTDDGDIEAQLSRLGFVNYHTSLLRGTDPPFKRPFRQVVEEILNTKWQLSAEAGHDVGTARAVKHWASKQ